MDVHESQEADKLHMFRKADTAFPRALLRGTEAASNHWVAAR